MKAIDRFILKEYLGPMILTFFIVMFVLMMNFIWRYIDELIGKGLEFRVIAELFMYASMTLIPMGLPLATLLASIMTMGNMGENYELLAMKSAGMSLPRIMLPLSVMVVLVSVSSFFVANNLVPFSMRKMQALIYDIRQQKQSIEFQDGLFFNGIENMSIRVGHQNPETKLLTDIIIYNTGASNGNMTVVVADSGYIRLSDDKRNLLATFMRGEMYELTRNNQWFDNNEFVRHSFAMQHGVQHLEGYDFSRTSSELFGGSQTQNIRHLRQSIDSLENQTAEIITRSYIPFFQNYLFTLDQTLMIDSLRRTSPHIHPVLVADSIGNLSVQDRKRVWQTALNYAKNSRGSFLYDEETAKETLNQLYRYKADLHRKMQLPVSILIFFLIGAPLGAIIRKGGLGMPIVISVIFFVIYYIISMTGEKLAKEGTWNSFSGMWLSTFILLPLALFLTYKATNDSNLFNAEWYFTRLKNLKDFFTKRRGKKFNEKPI